MSGSWIVCAMCQGTWPIQGTPTPYLDMHLQSQPCPRCEAYTLSCVALRNLTVLPVGPSLLTAAPESLTEAWHAADD